MRRHHLGALALLAAVLVAWATGMAVAIRDARLPDAASGRVLAVFDPRVEPEHAFAAVLAAGARPVRAVTGFVWVAQSDEAGLAARLRAQGASGVFGAFAFGPQLAGCVAYASTSPKPPPNVPR